MRRRHVLSLIALLAFLGTGMVTSVQVATAPPAAAYPLGDGYWLAADDGGIFSFGDAQFYGSTGAIKLNKPIVGMAAHPFLEGYWLVASDGGIFSFGSSAFWGSLGNIKLNQPIVGMATTPTGLGYWLVAADGGIFAFGDAPFLGSTGNIKLNKPIVGIAATPTGRGYWLVATDGGIFTFGDAPFLGSEGSLPLNKPIVDMDATQTGNGYYLVASDGGIFTHGDAVFRGSRGGQPLNQPVVGMAVAPDNGGYQFVATDGGIFNYGSSKFFGSTGGMKLNRPVFGMALRPRLAVKIDAYPDDASQSSNWVTVGTDSRLRLTKNAGTSTAAGARVLGLEGLDAGQLGVMGYTIDSGPCTDHLVILVAFDTTNDAVSDGSATFACTTGGVTATKRFDPATAGIPGNAKITAVDVLFGSDGETVELDDFLIVGLTIPDFNTYRIAV